MCTLFAFMLWYKDFKNPKMLEFSYEYIVFALLKCLISHFTVRISWLAVQPP